MKAAILCNGINWTINKNTIYIFIYIYILTRINEIQITRRTWKILLDRHLEHCAYVTDSMLTVGLWNNVCSINNLVDNVDTTDISMSLFASTILQVNA